MIQFSLKRTWIPLGLALALSWISGAESRAGSSLGYVLSFPTATSADFMDNISYRGIGFDSNWAVRERFAMGLSFRWLYFGEDRESDTYTQDNVSITGRQERSIDALPIFVQGFYFPPIGSGKFKPYVGLGVGAIYGQQQLQIGYLSFDKIGWQFALAPELGASIPLGETLPAIKVSARYDGGFGTDDIPAISYLSLFFGIETGF